MNTKVCGKCRLEKVITDFYYNNSKHNYQSACKQCAKEYQKMYRRKHKSDIAKQKYARKQERLKTDEVYRLKQQMNNLIYYSFKRKQKYKTTSKATKIFGCDWNYFYNHLLDTYKNRYGCEYNERVKVEVDHIIPMCRAYTTEDVIKLNHISNLQLLTKEDNSKKYIY